LSLGVATSSGRNKIGWEKSQLAINQNRWPGWSGHGLMLKLVGKIGTLVGVLSPKKKSTCKSQLVLSYYSPMSVLGRQSRMRQSLQVTVSLLCLAVISLGCRYAIGRERLHDTDPHMVYRQINRESFVGELLDVTVQWGDAGDGNYGLTKFYDDGSADIWVDSRTIGSERQLRHTIEHESCHICSQAIIEETHQDPHGEAFRTCMKRFE
jgi:SprT-like family